MILLGIVLFGALYVAVTGSDRGNKDASGEGAQSQAADIINYAGLLENAVSRLILSGGCKDSQLSFYGNASPYANAAYNNGSAPTDKRCHVFEQAGGGVSIRSFSSPVLDSTQSALVDYGEMLITRNNCAYNIGSAGKVTSSPACWQTGSGSASLIAILPYVTRETCLKINLRAFGFEEIPTEFNNVGVSRFAGSFTTGSKNVMDWGATTNIRSSSVSTISYGCLQMPASATTYPNAYVFWYVLAPR